MAEGPIFVVISLWEKMRLTDANWLANFWGEMRSTGGYAIKCCGCSNAGLDPSGKNSGRKRQKRSFRLHMNRSNGGINEKTTGEQICIKEEQK